MTVSALQGHSPRVTFSRTKRTRRFWSAMAGALRELDRGSDQPVVTELKPRAARTVLSDTAWRVPAAA